MSKHKRSSQKRVLARLEDSVLRTLPIRILAGVALIAAAVFLVFLPTISGGSLLDDELLTQNNLIKASDGLYRFWLTAEPYDYWPVSNTVLWIGWRLWGIHQTGCHVTNLVLHIAASLLLWLILRKLCIPGAFLAAIIFAVHPVNVESVAWVAQLKDMLAVLFFLLSILWYLKAEMRSSPPQNRFYLPGAGRWCRLSLLAFVMAMLSKGSVAVLPVLLLGIVWWLRPLTRWDLMRTAPFFIVAIVLSVVNVWFQTHGSGEAVRTAGFAERLLGAGSVVWFYLYKAILPVNLVFVYPQWNIQADKLLWWLPLLAGAVLTAVLWLYRKSRSRPFLFAWGFFCVALAPVMGFTDLGFMQYSLVADHYQHIAIIGVIALTAAGLSAWHRRVKGGSHWATTVIVVAGVGALAFLAWRQSRLYHDPMTLYQATLEKNPGCWMAYNNLGLTLVKTDRTEEAIEQYRKALRLKPDYHECYNNLGLALDKLGRQQEAIEQYREALRLKPDYGTAHYNLGNTLLNQGRLREAFEHYKQTLRFKADDPEVYNNLGVVFLKAGRTQDAVKYYKQALRLNLDYPEAHNNLGNILAQTGQTKEAIIHYKEALRLNPDYIDARYNLGLILLQNGRPGESIEHFKQAVQLKPDSVNTFYNLASAYAQTSRPSEAIAAAQKALELARSQGQTELFKQIEDWLNSYRAGLPK